MVSFYGYKQNFVTDTEAIAAVNLWTEYQSGIEITPAMTTLNTPVLFFSFASAPLVGGDYEFDALFIISGSASSTNIASDLQIGPVGGPPVSRGGSLLQTGVSGGQFVQGAGVPEPFPPGVQQQYDFLFWKSSGTGTVTAVTANLRMRRVA